LTVVWWQVSQRRTAEPHVDITVAPLPQDPDIQVYFNHNPAAVYTDPYRQRDRFGDDLEQVLVEAIASAQTSIDIAIHELRLPGVALALAERHRAGVRVRVILENTYTRPWSSLSPQDVASLDERDRGKYEDFIALADVNQDGQVSAIEAQQRDALVILAQAGVPLIDDTADGSAGSDLMHHKFLVVDGHLVIVGSANFTLSDTHGDAASSTSLGNANHLLRIDNVDLAQAFTQEFALMWGDGPGGQLDSLFGLQKPYRPPQTIWLSEHSTITVQFSPTSTSLDWEKSVNGLISRALATGDRSIDMALFVFSDQELSNRLEQRHQQGVQIRLLIDPGFAYRNYSGGLDLLGLTIPDYQCRYDADNRVWANPIMSVGIPQLPEGDILHHKFGVVDGHLVITGSQNWSAAANTGNDENLLVIDNATVAAHFEREFEQLYDTAALGIPPWLQRKVAEENARCGG
jgi:phosphatidylserine/phosphatidylglycerophosphate/cardiolipin synthase-like enzyme